MVHDKQLPATADEAEARSPHFSLEVYRAILESLRGEGYKFVSFHEAEPTKRHALLRHDVDLCMQRAVVMAEAEAEQCAYSIFFVLLSTRFYNLFAREDRQHLARLLALGHEVGLHFDATAYGEDLALLDSAARKECAVLEDLTGQPVKVVSFHRPVRQLIDLGQPFAGRRSAYESAYYCDMAYCSDSAGTFAYGHPLDLPAIAEGRAIQLLTHPIWWVSPSSRGLLQKLESLQSELHQRIDDDMVRNLKPWKKFVEGGRGRIPK